MNLAIIQARMGSSRLPGKVLMDLGGESVLKYMIKRVENSESIDKIIVATTLSEKDDPIVKECESIGVLVFRGSEEDVLDRYYRCAKENYGDIIIRLTSDCPLIDPKIIDKTVRLLKEENVDYAANTVPPDQTKFPDGSDVEVFSFKSLEKAWKESTDKKDREHVTFYFWKKDHKKFSTASLDNTEDWRDYRFTLDYEEDLVLIKEIIKNLKAEKKFGYTDEIIGYIRNNKSLFDINSMHKWGANW